MRKKKILLIGPYPPPFGGVSVHIKRLGSLMSGTFDIDIIDETRTKKDKIFNIRSWNIFKYLQKVFAADIVHIHSGKFILRLLHFLTASAFFKKKVITIHGYEPGRGDKIRTVDKIILNNCKRIVFVSKELAEAFGSKKYFIREAFLPPDLGEEPELPADLAGWIEKKKMSGDIICVANAWRLDRHNNEDLYGLDLCIMAAKKLKELNSKAVFIFIVCDNTGAISIEKYKQQIKDFELEECFLLLESPLSFVKLINKADVVLRPTNTDGDALTVREGLFFGKVVVASDVTLRPANTKLFRNRDSASLAKAIAGVKKHDQENTGPASDVSESITAYMQFYTDNIYS